MNHAIELLPPRRFLLGYNTSGFSRSQNIESVIARIAQAGFEAVEISFDPAHVMPDASSSKLAQLDAICRQENLSVACGAGARHALGPSPHQPSWISENPAEREAREQFLMSAVRSAAALRSTVLVLHSGPKPPCLTPEEALEHLRKGLSRLLPVADREGVRLALEFHPAMLIRDWKGAAALADTFPGLGLTLDVGHLQCTETLPLTQGIRKAFEQVVHIHLEDIRGKVHKHLPIGDGEIPFGEVFAILRQLGFAGIVAAEFHSGEILMDEEVLARRTIERLHPLL